MTDYLHYIWLTRPLVLIGWGLCLFALLQFFFIYRSKQATLVHTSFAIALCIGGLILAFAGQYAVPEDEQNQQRAHSAEPTSRSESPAVAPSSTKPSMLASTPTSKPISKPKPRSAKERQFQALLNNAALHETLLRLTADGQTLVQQGKLEQALRHFKVLLIYSHYSFAIGGESHRRFVPQFHHRIGQLHLAQKQYPQAQQHLEKAIAWRDSGEPYMPFDHPMLRLAEYSALLDAKIAQKQYTSAVKTGETMIEIALQNHKDHQHEPQQSSSAAGAAEWVLRSYGKTATSLRKKRHFRSARKLSKQCERFAGANRNMTARFSANTIRRLCKTGSR